MFRLLFFATCTPLEPRTLRITHRFSPRNKLEVCQTFARLRAHHARLRPSYRTTTRRGSQTSKPSVGHLHRLRGSRSGSCFISCRSLRAHIAARRYEGTRRPGLHAEAEWADERQSCYFCSCVGLSSDAADPLRSALARLLPRRPLGLRCVLESAHRQAPVYVDPPGHRRS